MSQEVIEIPTDEVLEIVRGEFGLNGRRVEEAVEYLKEWLQLQAHLPREIGESDKDTLHNITPITEAGT
jgi:hypothetical protein